VEASASPQTTVVIAVWDAYVSERLGDALASIRSQAPRTPIVVVDNASQTPLPPLPGAWVIRAPRRLSAGAARNLGLSRVTTPYVVFWDADDIMLPETLSTLENTMKANARLTAFGMAVLEDPGRTRHRWPRPWIKKLIRRPKAFALLHAMWSLYPGTGATVMRTELVRQAGGYGDANSGEDWSLGVSLAFRGPLGWTEQPGRLYHMHDQSLWSQNMTPEDLSRHAKAIRDRIRSDDGIPDRAKTALPLIWLGQWTAIGAHVALEKARARLNELRRSTPPSRPRAANP
jgi:hypothetical protein